MVNPEPAFKIDRVIEKGKCYVCGRQISAIVDLFALPKVKDEIAQRIEQRYKDSKARIDGFVASLRILLDETKAYRGDLTTFELNNNKGIASKIAPKFEELAKYAMEKRGPYDRAELKNCTIDEIRKNIEALITEIDRGDYRRVVEFEPDLVRSVETLKYNRETVEPGLDYQMKLASCTDTYHLDLGGHLIFARKDFNNRIVSYHRYETVGGETRISDEKMSADDVIELSYHYSICRFCSTLFHRASAAAFDVIHADDYDDWD